MSSYYKYQKYKNKYLSLKNDLRGGATSKVFFQRGRLVDQEVVLDRLKRNFQEIVFDHQTELNYQELLDRIVNGPRFSKIVGDILIRNRERLAMEIFGTSREKESKQLVEIEKRIAGLIKKRDLDPKVGDPKSQRKIDRSIRVLSRQRKSVNGLIQQIEEFEGEFQLPPADEAVHRFTIGSDNEKAMNGLVRDSLKDTETAYLENSVYYSKNPHYVSFSSERGEARGMKLEIDGMILSKGETGAYSPLSLVEIKSSLQGVFKDFKKIRELVEQLADLSGPGVQKTFLVDGQRITIDYSFHRSGLVYIVADPHSLRFTINETSIINIATENVKSYLETLELSRYMTSHRVLAGLLTQTLTEEQMAQIRAEYDGLRNKYVSNSPSPVLHPGSTLTGRPDPRQLVQRLDRALDREKIAESATRITEFISRVVILAPKAKL